MTSLLDDTFAKQIELTKERRNSEKHTNNILEFVKFSSANTSYLIELAKVREITDMPSITVYPQPYFGHIGLINLRGEILPVLSVDQDPTKHVTDKRAIVIEIEENNKICFPASNIKKVVLDAGIIATQSTFDLDGQASAFFYFKNLPALGDSK